MKLSLNPGMVVLAVTVDTHGIAVGTVSERNLCTVEECVEDIVSEVSDEIANAMLLMMEVVAEGAAAPKLEAVRARLRQT